MLLINFTSSLVRRQLVVRKFCDTNCRSFETFLMFMFFGVHIISEKFYARPFVWRHHHKSINFIINWKYLLARTTNSESLLSSGIARRRRGNHTQRITYIIIIIKRPFVRLLIYFTLMTVYSTVAPYRFVLCRADHFEGYIYLMGKQMSLVRELCSIGNRFCLAQTNVEDIISLVTKMKKNKAQRTR